MKKVHIFFTNLLLKHKLHLIDFNSLSEFGTRDSSKIESISDIPILVKMLLLKFITQQTKCSVAKCVAALVADVLKRCQITEILKRRYKNDP